MSSSEESSSEEVDLEIYRNKFESEEHWNLRKAFISTHWDSFTEQELLCLAQVYLNMELLGCKYNPETMAQVAQLASEVPEIRHYRASRYGKLKRTFVGAQNAVQSRLQGSDAKRKLGNDWTKKDASMMDTSQDWNEQDKLDIDSVILRNSVRLNETQKSENLRELLKDVIYFEMADDNDVNGSLNKTTACMQKIGKLEMTFDAEQKKYFYVFNGQIIAEGAGESKKAAKKPADEDLVKTLKTNCYTIKSKLEFFTAEKVVNRGQIDENPINSNRIQESNLGFKMLKMLGWGGGSLGAKNDGIVDPVSLEIKIGRRGLGADSSEEFDIKRIRNMLKNFKQNQVEYDLVFSSEFTKEERALIHQSAQQLNLRTKSFGKNLSRHIVISTKLSPQVLRQKLLEGDPHLLEKYEIIAPLPSIKQRVRKNGKKGKMEQMMFKQ